MSRDKWIKFGSVLQRKDGTGTYVKVSQNVTLTEGDIVQVKDPRVANTEMAKNGHISDEEAETRNSRIPDYVLFDLTLPPAKN